jgi:outer membrane receptor protein involved in Fe transport
LAGLPVTPIPQTAAQRVQGVVAVATQVDPRAVKSFVNDGRARYYGVETVVRYIVASRWTAEGNYSYILGRDLNPNRNIRRLPPQMGSATVRYTMPRRRAWVEMSMTAAGVQNRLNGGDRDDERIGASFRRRDIADFFQGSRVAPYLNGSVFLPTGETLAQIQDRVLPTGREVNGVLVVNENTRVPLYLSTAGWTTLNVRSGVPLGERWQIMASVENMLDRNYRFHGSGVDAPGASAYLAMIYRF